MITIFKDIVKNSEDKNIPIVYKEMLKLNFQLNNIMAAAEIENDVLEKNISEFDFSALLNDLKESFENLYNDKNIIINYELSDEFVLINHDREKLFFILSNLFDNAFKFSPDKSDVEFDVSLHDEKLNFTVKNTGNKINKRDFLESFQEKENEFLHEKRGLGLGFSIIKAYTDFMSGEFSINEDGNYNMVTIVLPYYSDNSEDVFGDELDSFDFGDFDDDDDDESNGVF